MEDDKLVKVFEENPKRLKSKEDEKIIYFDAMEAVVVQINVFEAKEPVEALLENPKEKEEVSKAVQNAKADVL